MPMPTPTSQTIDMALDAKAIETLSQVTTAAPTTILLKKGLRNAWQRGTRLANVQAGELK
jgi:hypothetical protein